MPKVTTKNGAMFECQTGQSIIDAGLEAGVVLEHSCRSGRCDTCKAIVLTGETELTQAEQISSLGIDRKAEILMCCRTAKTDIVLDVEGLTNFELFLPSVLPCKIESMELLTEDVMEIKFRFPPSANLAFNPGQYIDLKAPSGVVRSYSIANQSNDDALVLQVKNYREGVMSNYLFNDAKINTLMSIRGPLGTFHLRRRKAKHLVFLATGTGIAPILSMLALGNVKSPAQTVSVYWGVRRYSDLYVSAEDLVSVDHFRPVLSRENHAGYERGYVQDLLVRDFDSFQDVEVYACGSSQMIAAAFDLLTTNGLSPESFFSDAFVESHREVQA